ncbi:MAG: hypothetical protein ACYC5X_04795 [Syntrophales bacterium]
MAKKCLNCGYERKPEDDSEFTPASECPKCRAIYDKVEKWLREKETQLKEPITSRPVGDKSYNMGFFDQIRQFWDEEALGDQTVETVFKGFLKTQREMPYGEPHEILVLVWLHRISLKGHDINRPELMTMAFSETLLHSCIRPPLCARSLGLYFLYKESPHIIFKYPKFAKEYESLTGPIFKSQNDGTFWNLYSRYNPRMAGKAGEQ